MAEAIRAVNKERWLVVPITTEPRSAWPGRMLAYPETILPDRATAERFLAETADLRDPGEAGAVPFVTPENTLGWLLRC